MTHQTDLFASDETPVRSYRPEVDPARAAYLTINQEIDRDHVAAPVDGQLPVGALGNDRRVFVLYVHDKKNVLIHAETFPNRASAEAAKAKLRAAIDRNRQMPLL